MPKLWSEGGLTAAQIARIESEFRVPVDRLFGPIRHAWILALAQESLLPDDQCLRMLRDALEWQVEEAFQIDYGRRILAQPLAAEDTWNTLIFYLDEDGWHSRRATWTMGFPYWPAHGMKDRAPGGTLVEVLDHTLVGLNDGNAPFGWRDHKRVRLDLYGVPK
jgi:hypothetical protein